MMQSFRVVKILIARIGLIQNETPEMVKVVEDLVRDNIRGNECLILVTMPMSGEHLSHRSGCIAAQSYLSRRHRKSACYEVG